MKKSTKILTLDHDVSYVSKENKKIIPYTYATKIIFQNPEHIAVMDCPCKKSTGAAKEEINSCIAVGLGLTRFWMDHCQKYHPRKITQQEALDLERIERTC